MLRELLTKQGIKKLLAKIRIGGRTPASILKENRNNTKAALKRNFRDSVMADVDSATFAQSLGRVVKSRKRQTLSTLRNIMSSVRGEARAVLATGKGYWLSRGVLDSGTTDICARLKGARYHMSYSQVPMKPPRVPPPHPCRSFLVWVPEGTRPPTEETFEQEWRNNPELQRDLLGKSKFEAFERGELGRIETYAQYEKVVTKTLEDLNIEK